MRNLKKVLLISIPIVLFILGGVFWWRYYFVFGEGSKAGNLNFVVKKGYIFKTWEGRIIQEGFKTPVPGQMTSNQFDFSIANDEVAKKLEESSGQFVRVHYKEFRHPIAWRGMSEFVVTEVEKVEPAHNDSQIPAQQ